MKNEFKTTILAMFVAGAAVGTTLPAVAQDTQAPADQAAPGVPGGPGDQPGPMPFMGKGQGMMDLLRSFDKNGDGKVTADEIQAGRKAAAASIDANGDGKISAEELANAEIARLRPVIEARAKARVAALDTDGDGLLSAAELAMPPLPERMMERLGADGDGIDLAKIGEGRGPMMGPMMGGRGFGPEGHGQMGRPGMPGGPGMMQGGHGPQEPQGDCHGGPDGATPPAPPAPGSAN